LLPDGWVVEGEMAVRLGCDRQQNEARIWHPAGLLLGNCELGRVDEIIGRVDPKDRNRDARELRGGIVAPAGIQIIKAVVGVDRVDSLLKILIGVALGLQARRRPMMKLEPNSR
jgi:hypothetical protein